MSNLRQRALELLSGDYSLDDAIASKDLPELLQELRIAQIELQLQNEELRQTQEALEKAHRKYFDYYELAPVGYMTLDEKGFIQEANLTARQMLRDDGRPITKKPFASYVERDNKQAFYMHLQDVVSGNSAQLEPLLLTVGNHKERFIYVSLQSKPHPFSDGRSGMMVIMTNITRRHELERQLRDKQHCLEDAQRQAKLGYWRYHFQTGDSEWSGQLYHLLGYEPHTIPASYDNFIAKVHPDDQQIIKQAIETSVEKNTPLNIEIRLMQTPEVMRVLHVRSFRHEDETDPYQLQGITQDITELRQAQEEALRAELERARMDVLTHFIRDASHEFRTPLTIIQSSIELVKRKNDMAFFEQRYPRMINQIERISRILDTMLLSSKLSMMREIQHHPILPYKLLDKVTHALHHNMPEHERDITLDAPEDLPAIAGDEALLIDAFYELLHNAVRYSNKYIQVRAFETDGHINISIRDDGDGVPAALRERIFEAFYRLDEAHTSTGTGLGLTITRQIIDLHEGKVAFTDNQPHGATVCVKLPVYQHAPN